ncbi:TetR family transcriptional regulator [bacterium]|nr:TetR family transcriptional regulator [bacterium]
MEDYKARIHDAAVQVFAEKGIDSTTLADIAATAGLDEAALHVYYRDTETLFRTISTEQTNAFIGTMLIACETIEEPEPFLREIVRIVDNMLMSNPDFLRITLHAMLERREIFFHTMESPLFPREVFDRFQWFMDEGKLRRVDPVQLALILDSLTFFTQVLRDQLELGQISDKQIEAFMQARHDTVLQTLLHGLLPQDDR